MLATIAVLPVGKYIMLLLALYNPCYYENNTKNATIFSIFRGISVRYATYLRRAYQTCDYTFGNFGFVTTAPSLSSNVSLFARGIHSLNRRDFSQVLGLTIAQIQI
jgi:hypothetical protein